MVDDDFAQGDSKKNSIGLIVVVVLVVLVVLGLFGFLVLGSLNYFGVINVPILPSGSSNAQVLFIGQPSLGEKVLLDSLSYAFSYRVRDSASFGDGAGEELNQYDIIIFDQSNSADKSVTVTLGEAIKKYVEKGGKLIVVLNSGVYQSSAFGVDNEVVGWKATFGNMIPAECLLTNKNVPSCAIGQEINIVGKIYRQDYDHPIMEGIEISPPSSEVPYVLKTLAIQADEGAKTIAYIKAENTLQTFPAILEKKTLIGNVIYFNYDPGITPGIFKNTLMYLK